jgi:transcription elongation factor S-II
VRDTGAQRGFASVVQQDTETFKFIRVETDHCLTTDSSVTDLFADLSADRVTDAIMAEKETDDLLKVLEVRHAALLTLCATDAGGDSEEVASTAQDCIDALKKLQKIPMTPGILSRTNAGKRLKAFSKPQGAGGDVASSASLTRLASLAKQIVSDWKAMVVSMRQSPCKAENREAAEVKAAATTPTPTPRQEKSGQQQATTNNDTNDVNDTTGKNVTNGTNDTGSSPPELTGDTIRDKIRTRLFDALCICRRQEGVAAGDEGELACAIEDAMFKTLDGTSAKYKSKFQQLHFNLKDPKNPDLRRKVVMGECGPLELLSLSPEELASDAKREENQRIRDKKLFDSAPSQAKKATTDQFQCGKCRQRKCTYYQMQTRSADEPMTTFVSCLNCGNRWKFC